MKTSSLPPGQKPTTIFPRFGLSQYADRFPNVIDKIQIEIGGDVNECLLDSEIKALPRKKQVSDFHCVTTWSKKSLTWEGVRFKDVLDLIIKNNPEINSELKFVILKGQDGYKTSLFVEDLIKEDVMLADTLDGKPLNIAHGAPVRLIAPAHYGYKNLKHLYRIEFYKDIQKVKQGFLRFMDHPRARVSLEERALGGPGWIFRYLYRPLISSTSKQFEKALLKHEEEK